MAKCLLCPEEPADPDLLDHLRLMHPDEYGDGPECWPDGGLVLVDRTDVTADEIGDGDGE